MARNFLLMASISGLLVVVFGAFGAHALEARLPVGHLIWWQKAVNYQGLHSLALLAVGLLAIYHPSRVLAYAGWFFLAGILLFSGSLYLLTLTDLRGLGLVTPFGGTAFIAGWACLALAAWRLPR